MEQQQKQLIEEKNILSEQLQAESEMCAEAEEVSSQNYLLSDWLKLECGQKKCQFSFKYRDWPIVVM